MVKPRFRFGSMSFNDLPIFYDFLAFGLLTIPVEPEKHDILVQTSILKLTSVTNDTVHLQFAFQVSVYIKSVHNFMVCNS